MTSWHVVSLHNGIFRLPSRLLVKSVAMEVGASTMHPLQQQKPHHTSYFLVCVSATNALAINDPLPPYLMAMSPNQWSNLGSSAQIVRAYDVKYPEWNDYV